MEEESLLRHEKFFRDAREYNDESCLIFVVGRKVSFSCCRRI